MSRLEYAPGEIVHLKFTTRDFDTGAPAALASGAVSIYKDDLTEQTTTGVTLTASLDSVTGLNHIRVETDADRSFYVGDATYYAVITAGTVDSVSVVGEVVGSFRLRRQTVPLAVALNLWGVTQTWERGRVSRGFPAKVTRDTADVATTGTVALNPWEVDHVNGGESAPGGFLQGTQAWEETYGVVLGSGDAGEQSVEDIADTHLDRRLDLGRDNGADTTTGRTVRQAHRPNRNKTSLASGIFTVYKEDDSTESHTAAATTAAGDPLTELDPT